jgi:nucleoside-diphosphate-sugar epimerase
MKLLVTGSEGSLMQWVIPRLLEQGHEVRGADNFVRYGHIQRDRDYEFVEANLTDAAAVDRVMDGIEGVLQGAALIFGVGGFHKHCADILADDIAIQRNVLRACVAHRVAKIAYVSSSMVFERVDEHPSHEDTVFKALIPATDYGLSKVVGERLCMAFHTQYGLDYTIWRPFNIITPFETGDEEIGVSHVFADFIENIVVRRLNPLPIIGDGQQVRCFTWIGDVADAVAGHSFTTATSGAAFNLGNAEPLTMIDLARRIHATAIDLGLLPPASADLRFETTKTFAADVRKRIPDVSRARDRLGWEATVGIDEAVRRCLEQVQARQRELA